jgi:uncharacterized membrane protein
MNTRLGETIALGAMSGMRSMSGPAVLAMRAPEQNALTRAIPALAVGEMIADKLPFMGDRIDPLPLAGRAMMGALVGGYLAREDDGNVILGGLLGAATAVIVAHLAYRARIKATESLGATAGFVEDGLVIGIGSGLVAGTSKG